MRPARVVTDDEVGILSGPHIFRGLAEAAHRRHHDPHGPVEYRVERRGRGYHRDTMRAFPPRPARHRHGHRSPTRNRQAQQRMRDARIALVGATRCEDCGETRDIRATHIIAVADGGSYDVTNCRLRCRDCDMRTDPYAR